MTGRLTIGALTRRTGVTARAIRLYERTGILPQARRTPAGYRLFSDDAVEVLRFVRQASGLGLTLAEIRDVVAIRRGGRPPCAHVQRLLRDKATELDRKLQDLVELRDRIRRSLAAWTRRPITAAAVCPHIEVPARRKRTVAGRTRG